MAERNDRRLLLVGPFPPPVGGASVSFEIFCEEAKRSRIFEKIQIINTSAPFLKARSRILAIESLIRGLRIVTEFCQRIGECDQVLIFGSNGFVLSTVPLLVTVAGLRHKQCFLRVFGGSLDRYYVTLPSFLRPLLDYTFRQMDGVLVQTQLVYDHFSDQIGTKLHVIPGYRAMENMRRNSSLSSMNLSPVTRDELHLIYLGHIKEEKGIFVLLEALRILNQAGDLNIVCHFWGPINPADEERFRNYLASITNADYKGVVCHEHVISTLRDYDLLVFPSYYSGEGHPGILLEAMLAGLPVIATGFRSIPELIQDRVNGLLVRPKDVQSLADTIRAVYRDRSLLARMGDENYQARIKYETKSVVPRIFEILG